MDDELWSRLPAEVQVELDELIISRRTVQALQVMREHMDPPLPALWDCVEALQERADVLEVSGPIRSRASSE
ncbi:hypothetical protein [Streptomyces sp. NPDC090112]|uniref:hypothetical protein n=1 Tax=Streptomyces sp. NPDC090112 TaxID=3365949 RepID=UPI003809B74E